MPAHNNGKRPDRFLKRSKDKDYCKGCRSKNSACRCEFKNPGRKMEPLASDCNIVNSVICSKEVQKVGHIDIPINFLDVYIENGVLTPPINVIINESDITQNTVVLRDKVVNIGIVPITVTVEGVPYEDLTGVNFIFQEETDCPGACPGDNVTETPLKVEAVIIQPISNALISYDQSEGMDTARVKIILGTTLTVTRSVVKDKDGHLCDLNERRCETRNRSMTLPGLPGTPVDFVTPNATANSSRKAKQKGNEDPSTPESEE